MASQETSVVSSALVWGRPADLIGGFGTDLLQENAVGDPVCSVSAIRLGPVARSGGGGGLPSHVHRRDPTSTPRRSDRCAIGVERSLITPHSLGDASGFGLLLRLGRADPL